MSYLEVPSLETENPNLLVSPSQSVQESVLQKGVLLCFNEFCNLSNPNFLLFTSSNLSSSTVVLSPLLLLLRFEPLDFFSNVFPPHSVASCSDFLLWQLSLEILYHKFDNSSCHFNSNLPCPLLELVISDFLHFLL